MTSKDERTIALSELRRRYLGKTLILAGVAVWAVWLATELSGGDPQVGDYLPFHLGGVIPGALIHRWDWLVRLLSRRFRRK